MNDNIEDKYNTKYSLITELQITIFFLSNNLNALYFQY